MSILPGVSVVVMSKSNDKVAICKRSELHSFAGMWCLPCGYIEPGETPQQAAIREVREELGFEIKLKSILNVYTNIFGNSIQTLVVAFLSVYVCGEFRKNDEITEMRFIYPHKYINYCMAYASDKQLLSDIANGIIDLRGQIII